MKKKKLFPEERKTYIVKDRDVGKLVQITIEKQTTKCFLVCYDLSSSKDNLEWVEKSNFEKKFKIIDTYVPY